MDQQSLLEKILESTTSNKEAVDSMKTDVGSLKDDMSGVKTDVRSLKDDMSGVKTDVRSLKDDMSGVQETVEFVKDNAAAKVDVETVVSEAKDEIITQVDGFISLHNKLETELVALQSKYERLEEQMQQIAKHVQLELS